MPLKEGESCLADNQLEKNDPVKHALNFNNFICPFRCQQCAGVCTEELEFAILACNDTDLVGLKGIRKHVFLHTTDVDSSPRQSLH